MKRYNQIQEKSEIIIFLDSTPQKKEELKKRKILRQIIHFLNKTNTNDTFYSQETWTLE
jgi:hypothetical protein